MSGYLDPRSPGFRAVKPWRRTPRTPCDRCGAPANARLGDHPPQGNEPLEWREEYEQLQAIFGQVSVPPEWCCGECAGIAAMERLTLHGGVTLTPLRIRWLLWLRSVVIR